MQLNRGDGEVAIDHEVPANQAESSHDSTAQSQDLTISGPRAHLGRSGARAGYRSACRVTTIVKQVRCQNS
jgi:hypothetical protein